MSVTQQRDEESVTQGRLLGQAGGGQLRFYVYALILLTAALQNSVAPLIPEYARRYSMSGTDVGLFLGAPGIATIATSLLSGPLADRFDARRLTVASAWILVVSAIGQGLAPSFGILILARVLFGTGYGVLWTAGLAWLASTTGDTAKSGLGATVAYSGIGGILGPAFAGIASEYIGLEGPWLLLGSLLVAVTILLHTVKVEHVPRAAGSASGGVSSARRVADDLRVVTAVVAVIVASICYSVTALLGPLELERAGMSESTIGLAFSLGAVLYFLASSFTALAGRRAVTVGAAVVAAVACAAALAPGGISVAPVVIIGVLCLGSAARGVVWTVTYPLAERGAERAGAGVGVVLGLLNGTSAAMTVLTPLVAGTLADSVGGRNTFELAAVACLAVLGAWWLFVRMRNSAGRPDEVLLVHGPQV